jgi:hypothetical protein
VSEPNGRFSLDARREARAAAESESARDLYEFEWCGKTFTLKPREEMPANAKRLFAEAEVADVLDALLNDPDEFWSLRPYPTMADINDLLEDWGQWSGVGGLGESGGSQPPASTQT